MNGLVGTHWLEIIRASLCIGVVTEVAHHTVLHHILPMGYICYFYLKYLISDQTVTIFVDGVQDGVTTGVAQIDFVSS